MLYNLICKISKNCLDLIKSQRISLTPLGREMESQVTVGRRGNDYAAPELGIKKWKKKMSSNKPEERKAGKQNGI